MSSVDINNGSTPTSNYRNKTKVAKPNLYYGDRNTLKDQLLQFDLYFKFGADNVEPDDQTSLITTYIRGDAAKQIRPFLIKYIGDRLKDNNLIRIFEDFNHFKTKIC